jgi:hypothetical protein
MGVVLQKGWREMDGQRITRDEAEQGSILDQIAMRLEGLGSVLRPAWRADIKTMKRAEVQALERELQRTHTRNDANNAVVKAITDSNHARRAAEDKKFDDLGVGPANVDEIF